MNPIKFTNVSISDRFWTPRLEINRRETLFFEYRELKETGHIDAFRLDWKPGRKPVPDMGWDSDVYKWIEAASYSLATNPEQCRC